MEKGLDALVPLKCRGRAIFWISGFLSGRVSVSKYSRVQYSAIQLSNETVEYTALGTIMHNRALYQNYRSGEFSLNGGNGGLWGEYDFWALLLLLLLPAASLSAASAGLWIDICLGWRCSRRSCPLSLYQEWCIPVATSDFPLLESPRSLRVQSPESRIHKER